MAQAAAHYADVASSIFSMVLMSDQTLFIMYHYNSYANNPVMLRSTKPMVMRDIFLTQVKTGIPNPLSAVYVHKEKDCVINCIMSMAVAKPICLAFGWRHATALYLGGGFFSSFAYIFQAQINKNKVSSEFDCACTSNGAYATLATLSLFMPKSYVPYSKRLPIATFGLPYLLMCTYDEYIGPTYFEKRKPGDIEVRNWGFVGGAFFALIYGTLFLRTKKDFGKMKLFYNNIAKAKIGSTTTVQ